ncbi:hypothetical protein JCM10908_006651 [Rhodotorula pacifica]|uniref:uncharacterized protein n=1 Tax=Rhodotorula pacifica TaxID=1495444 RepID=UPI003173AEA2
MSTAAPVAAATTSNAPTSKALTFDFAHPQPAAETSESTSGKTSSAGAVDILKVLPSRTSDSTPASASAPTSMPAPALPASSTGTVPARLAESTGFQAYSSAPASFTFPAATTATAPPTSGTMTSATLPPSSKPIPQVKPPFPPPARPSWTTASSQPQLHPPHRVHLLTSAPAAPAPPSSRPKSPADASRNAASPDPPQRTTDPRLRTKASAPPPPPPHPAAPPTRSPARIPISAPSTAASSAAPEPSSSQARPPPPPNDDTIPERVSQDLPLLRPWQDKVYAQGMAGLKRFLDLLEEDADPRKRSKA